jgi:receptor protein-tyrosine kinase
VVLVPAGVYALSTNLTKTFEAKTVLFVQETTVASEEFSEQTTVSTSSPATVARLVETPVVADSAARKLGEPGAGRALLKKVDAELDVALGADAENNFLTIYARDSDPERAADIAEAFGAAVARKRSKEVESAIDQTLEDLAEEGEVLSQLGDVARLSLAEQIQGLQTLRSTQEGATQVVDPVQVPESAISPKPIRNTVLGFIFAALLAIGLLPLLERLDRKLRDPEEFEELLGKPLLAMIPPGAFPGVKPSPHVREAFQTLRAALTYFNVDHALGSVVVTSAGHAEGKTTVATNLAVALAQDGRDVVLVDADLRRPQAARRLGIEGSVGLESVLLSERSATEALVQVPGVTGGRLRVLPVVTPPPNPAVLVGSERMDQLLGDLKSEADLVILDTAPLLVVSDTIPLVRGADGVVLVTRVDHTNRDAALKASDVIEKAEGTLLGVVATGTRASGLYGYDLYGYDQEAPESEVLPAMRYGVNGNGRGRGRLGRLFRRKREHEQV